MIRVQCDRCDLILDNEKAFKMCEVHDGNIKDTTILCAPCMKAVALDVIRHEKERAENARKILEKWKEGEENDTRRSDSAL